MSAWPSSHVHRPSRGSLSTASAECCFGDMCAAIGASMGGTGTSWPANNRAFYVPVEVEHPITVYQMGIEVGTQSGNVDVGIYDLAGNRLVSAGSTAMAAAGVQVFNVTDTVLLPGTYFLAVNVSTTGAAIRGSTLVAANARINGVQQENVGATALPLAASFTASATAFTPFVFAAYNATTV